MRPIADLPDYATPFYLFGNARPPAARPLSRLVAAGVLSPSEARSLISVAQSDRSMAIVTPHASAGKTSLLAALLPYVEGSERYFLRGSYETFSFTQGDSWRPRRAILIANEISDFLPVYLPGDLARRAFALVGEGARLWATAHAGGRHELLDRWRDWPAATPLAVVTLLAAPPGVSIDLRGPERHRTPRT